LWVTLRNEGRILGLDPSGGEVETSIDLGKNADRIAVDPERKALWVTSPADLMVTVIDLPRRQVAVEYELPGKPALLALLDGSAWVATQSPNLLVKLDPRDTGEPPQWELDGLPIGLASDPATASLWIGVSGANAVQRFVPSRGQVTDSLEVATEPRVLIVDGGTLWVGGGDKVVKVPVDRPADATVRRVGRGVFSMVLAGDELWVASSVDRSVEFIAAR
jgi:streptogramin lyase